mmetsp:Transcript_95008/g.164992  ORF Transcript_95008/g.164992 Transcript_95008/m.164992 type:complete len:422 (+) Transcript_95008:27-1292(+)
MDGVRRSKEPKTHADAKGAEEDLPQAEKAASQVASPTEQASASPSTAAAAPTYQVPRKRINSQRDLEIFTKSRLCEQLLSFAGELSQATRGIEISASHLDSASPIVKALVEVLDELERWIDDFPPLQQPMRFGNKAFRQWHARLVERAHPLMREALRKARPSAEDASTEALALELSHYLRGSFGDETRIDYGTGHEAAFFAVLFILGAHDVLAKADARDAVLLVFAAYIRVMRRLQTVYVQEPAGSHGAWGLDDFHALPFLFGAAQLIGKEDEVPTGTVYQESVVREYADRFLYIDAIRQVLQVKRGAPFHETSPMLYDITAVPTWQRIHSGLVRMYRAEVLGKHPVIQHFLFGETLRWPGGDDSSATAAPPSATRAGTAGAAAGYAAAAMPPPLAPQKAPVVSSAVPGWVPCAAPWARPG